MDHYEVRITNRATRHSWTVKEFCLSMEEAIRLAHLTFSPVAFEVVDAKANPPSSGPSAEQKELF